MQDSLKIGKSQLSAFRGLRAADGRSLTANFRPTQPLNGRKVVRVPGDRVRHEEKPADLTLAGGGGRGAGTVAHHFVLTTCLVLIINKIIL